ncbi:protein DnaJ [Seminavis robusta]|uniref:Protein DnaJ n=1 Tax=Seminavis robusta TaxID=568900 RepID=A0A9N8HM35_9STRA|nr:protein DnaJ [Seminavis robusta]|eukprot:Sro865_g212780.1 protein DnaJ (396) ;mRNA; r:9210-10496
MSSLRCVLFVFFAVVSFSFCDASTGFSGDPYKVFGLGQDASQDEIRSQYKKLCLKYHPDKTVDKSPSARKRCTERFKQIQAANDMIGDAESRRSYDLRSAFSPQAGRGAHGGFPRHQFRNEDVDAFYRSFAGAYGRNPQYTGPRKPFNFQPGNSVFSTRSFARTAAMFRNGNSLKSTFVQKVKVPLQDLYNGRSSMDLQVHDTLWKSYCAAFRGGFGYLILYQSLIFAAPALRISRLLTLAFSALVFHIHVPRPSHVQFTADIQPGYKEGTKIIFSDETFETVFLLEEEKHDRFTRVGNDLHTSVDILASQARSGCRIEIEPLNPTEEPVSVRIRPNQINPTNNVVTVEDKGWPNRKLGRRGNLVVKFRIVQKLKKKKKGKRRQGSKKASAKKAP